MLNKHLVFILVLGDLLVAESNEPGGITTVPRLSPDVTSGTDESNESLLSVSVWEVYSDTVVLDWYITLQDKFRMNNCQIVYGPTEDDDEDEDIVKNFIPDHRSFQIKNLQCNTSYWLVMTCTDIYGSIHNSSVLNFTTDNVDVRLPKYSHIIQDQFQQFHGDRQIGLEARNARPGTVKRREMTLSPHALLGLGCGILLFVICLGTVLVIIVNYIHYSKQSKDIETTQPSVPVSPAYGEVERDCSEQMLTISWHCSMQESCSNINMELSDVKQEKEENRLIDI